MAGEVKLNTPRSMLPAYEKNMPVTTFFRDTFFPGVVTFTTESVDMDYRKGAYKVAPFVAPNIGGIIMDRQGFETKSYSPPMISIDKVLDPKILQTRLPGETTHTSMSPEERQDYYMQQDAKEMDDSITRREEVMCADLVVNGQITVRKYVDDNLATYQDETITYGFTQKTILSGGDAWNQTTSDKLGDLEEATEAVIKGGAASSMVIFGADAWKLFKGDSKVQAYFDKLRLNIGTIEPSMRMNGLKYCGALTELGLEMWVYYGYYLDYDGVVKPIMPLDHIVVTPPQIGEMLYGAVTYVEDDKRYHTYEGTRIPLTLVNRDNNIIKNRLSSRPIPRPYDVDSWVSIKVK